MLKNRMTLERKKCYNGGKQAGHNGTDSPEEGTERTDGMARL